MPPLNLFSRTCVALAISQSVALPSQGASIEVNDPGDPGSSGDSMCTLREAIVTVNEGTDTANLENAAGCFVSGALVGTLAGMADTITFSQGLANITLGAYQTAITSNVDIIGPGQDALTIDGNQNYQLFTIDSATVSLHSLTISGGIAVTGGAGIDARYSSNVSVSHSTVSGNRTFYGGAIYARSGSTVSLTSSTVSENVANKGGGIYAISASIRLDNSIVSGNSAKFNGSGIHASNSSVSLANSTVSDNSAKDGGGIYAHDSSSISLTDSTVSGNSAESSGGGVFIYDSSYLSLDNSTVTDNSANGNSGGVYAQSSSSVSLNNSTVSGNSASFGGGIFVATSSSASLNNSTVSGNSAGGGGGIYARSSSTVSLNNSIVSGNSSNFNFGTEIDSYIGFGANIFIADNHNLFGENSRTGAEAFINFTPGTSDINATSDGDIVSIHQPTPLASILKPLADNGGLTETHALMAGSPAIDAGDSALCTSNGITNDQRGEPRDTKCDIGAFEFIGGEACYVINGAGGKTIVFCL